MTKEAAPASAVDVLRRCCSRAATVVGNSMVRISANAAVQSAGAVCRTT
ncbi:hypothetical protein [Streptomyces camelliae]|uniref:Uncharacterized protein n=1 Tax=Streptomyces camelliae TaxID=3004093 RepID=A0ABY7PG56_9ACTN|nr:hypothetical protein [Streptomyces sp. HUAS 2-6]WBO69624.1 hypothetical protein O1G22_43560 [Streptomyces sp. HUAS 2-6]